MGGIPGQMLEVMEQRKVEIAPAKWYLTSRLWRVWYDVVQASPPAEQGYLRNVWCHGAHVNSPVGHDMLGVYAGMGSAHR